MRTFIGCWSGQACSHCEGFLLLVRLQNEETDHAQEHADSADDDPRYPVVTGHECRWADFLDAIHHAEQDRDHENPIPSKALQIAAGQGRNESMRMYLDLGISAGAFRRFTYTTDPAFRFGIDRELVRAHPSAGKAADIQPRVHAHRTTDAMCH